MAIAFIAAATLFTILKANGRIDGKNTSEEDVRTQKKEYLPSKPCEFYDDSRGDSYLFNGWLNGDLDTDMYGNPLNPKRYARAKRREARYLGRKCL